MLQEQFRYVEIYNKMKMVNGYFDTALLQIFRHCDQRENSIYIYIGWLKNAPPLCDESFSQFTYAITIEIDVYISCKIFFGIHDPNGPSYLSQLRVGLSKLSFQKFKHNFRDIIKPHVPNTRWG